MATIGTVKLTWNGPAVTGPILVAIDAALDETGQAGRAEAKRRARVDKGDMRDSIDYTVSSAGSARVLTLVVGTGHGYFNEVGTSRLAAQPMIRPAIDQEAPKLGNRIRAQMGGR